MREFTFLIFIIFRLSAITNSIQLHSVNSTEPAIQSVDMETRVDHLKEYCGVKNWTKKMPDWLMFRTGPGLMMYSI